MRIREKEETAEKLGESVKSVLDYYCWEVEFSGRAGCLNERLDRRR